MTDLKRFFDEALNGFEPKTDAYERTRERAQHHRGRRRRVAMSAIIGLVAVSLLAVVGLVAINNSDRDRIVASKGGVGVPPGQCRPLSRSPLKGRIGHSAVWTGKEMIIWGGESQLGSTPLADGAAYDPSTDRWRRIASAPLEPRSSHVAVWTGTEMIVWGGNDSKRSLRDGAAYNPTTDTWRPVPVAPMRGTSIPAVVWTGHEMLVLGGLESVEGGGAARHDAAAYDPTDNTWRTLSPDPFENVGPFTDGVWTGDRVVFVANSEVGATRVASYDPRADRWAGSSITFDGSAIGLPVWDGTDVLVFVGGTARNFAVDPKTLTTRGVGDGPDYAPQMGSLLDPAWTGDRVLYWASGATAEYRPETDRWTAFDVPNDFVDVAGETTVWTGSLLIAWGGLVNGRFGESLLLKTGVAYRPTSSTNAVSGLPCSKRQAQAHAVLPPTKPAPKPSDVRVLIVDKSGTETAGADLATSLRGQGYDLVGPPKVQAPDRHSMTGGVQCRPATAEASVALLTAVRRAITKMGFGPYPYSITTPGELATPGAAKADCVVTLAVPCIPRTLDLRECGSS